MHVTILRFEWEAVAEQVGVWRHTEYVIEFQLDVDSVAEVESQTQNVDAAPIRWTIRRRYTDFFKCHNELKALHASDLPELPPKEPVFQRMLGSFSVRRDWQESRRTALQSYASTLLSRPDLCSKPCVQQLLALSACIRLTAPPEPPDSIRARPVKHGDRFLEGLEISVQQARASFIEDSCQLQPVEEIVVVFRQLPCLCDADCSTDVFSEAGFTGRGIAARAHLKVESAVAEITRFVDLVSGYTYSIEASSISVTGMQSLPVKLIARVPDNAKLASKVDCSCASKVESLPVTGMQSLPDGEYSPEVEVTNLTSVCDEEKLCPSPRSALALRLGSATFRGTAASEYTAVVAEKTRQSFEKSPFQLLSGGLPQNVLASEGYEESPEKLHVHVQMQVEEFQREGEHTIHREVELLDNEREQVRQQKILDNASCVATWLGATTGLEYCVGMDGSDLTALREALLSGETLCEHANILARLGGESKCPVPSYHHNPSTKFRRMENVSMFIKACRDFFKLPEHQLFCTADLTEEGRDMWVVVQCLLALGRQVKSMYPEFDGPHLSIASPVGSFEASPTSST